MTYYLNPFACFSIGKCQVCKKAKAQIRKHKDKQMCSNCWIPLLLLALKNEKNQGKEQQILINKNLKICGFKEKDNLAQGNFE